MNDPSRAYTDTNGQTRGDDKPAESSRTTEQFASAAHEAVDRVAKTAGHAEQEVRARAAQVADKARESEEWAMESLEENVRKARAYAKRNPLATAGIAFAAGLVISSLIRR